MTGEARRAGLASLLGLVVVAAVMAAVVAVAAQRWLFGEANPAITGGISGAIGALVPSLARRSR